MADSRATCAPCGARLAENSPLGSLCPRCLVELALHVDDEGESSDRPPAAGPYALLHRLGEGGMGVVWLASQEHPIRRTVAIKLVKPGSASPQVLGRFESERQALALLNHPHIATVYDAGVAADGRPYFAMEYVAGLPITRFADQHLLPLTARLELFLQVCDAVEHAHQKGVLHRDLKPANILVVQRDGGPMVKIIDFGIAKALGGSGLAEHRETQLGTLVGTPEYMSPEQAGLSTAGVDTRTDIYSLGVVLYELLAGTLPFDTGELRGRPVFETLRVIREQDSIPLSTRVTRQSEAEIGETARLRSSEPRVLIRQLRDDLEWITSRALQKAPESRYASASELGADVRRYLASEPVIAGPPDLAYRLRKLVGRHQATAIATAVAVTALVAAAVVSSVMWFRAEHASRENRDRLKALHVTSGLDLASAGDDLKALPWLVRALQLEEAGAAAEEVHRIRIRHLLERVPYPIRMWKHDGLIDAYLAPDRTTLATWDDEGVVRLWDATRGETLVEALTHPAPIVSLRIDGSSVVTGDSQGVVRVWDARSGKATLGDMTHGSGLALVRIAAATNRLLSAGGDGTVLLRTLDSGDVVRSLRLERAVLFAEFVDAGQHIAVGDATGVAVIVDAATGEVTGRVPYERAAEPVAVISLDAYRVAIARSDGVMQVWNRQTDTVEPTRTPIIPNGAFAARLSASGASAFLCGEDGVFLIAIGRTSNRPPPLDDHRNCRSLDASADSLLVAGAYTDGTVRVWLPNGGAMTPKLPHPAAPPLVAFLSQSHELLTVDAGGLVRVWDLRPAARKPSSLFTFSAQFDRDGRRLAWAQGSTDRPAFGAATVLDVESGESLLPPLRHGGNVRHVAFSPDGRLIATSSDAGTARLWDAITGEPTSPELRHATGEIRHIVFAPEGTRLLTFASLVPGASDATLWRVPQGQREATLPDTANAFSGEFSPDSRHFVTEAANPPRARVWQTNGGQPLPVSDWFPAAGATFVSNSEIAVVGVRALEIRRLDGSATSVALPMPPEQDPGLLQSRDSLVVATGGGALRVVNTRDLSPRFPPLMLPGAISTADASGDGRWLVAASWDRRARVWSMTTGEPLTPERAMPFLPFSVSFAPDSSRVHVSGVSATFWELAPDDRPVSDLEAVAQLLSGHELVGTQLVALPVDRLFALVANTPSPSPAPASAARDWSWMLANYHLPRGEWAAAEAHLASLVADPDASWEMHAAYGNTLAERGAWPDAQRAFAAARKRRPDSTELLFLDAMARLGGGIPTAVDDQCAAGLQEFGATRNPDRAHWLARLCVLALTLDDVTGVRVRDLARLAADVEPDIGRHINVYAAALIRTNDASQAERLLLSLQSRTDVVQRETGVLFLSTAQRLLGKLYQSAEPPPTAGPSPREAPVPWYRRLEAATWSRTMSRPQ